MATSSSQQQRGIALIVALWLIVVVAGIVTTGAMILQSHRKQTRLSFARDAQAVQIARSGLTEARSWLNRQTSQPVTAFEPVLDTGANPPVLDTIDPTIGIVREFEITDRTWARYEVWKEWNADPDPVRLAWRQRLQCEDVWEQRSTSGPGAAWRLQCIGYVYERIDPNAAFNVRPNYVVAKEVLDVEVQRLILQLPGESAINIGDGNSCHINTKGRIIGGGAGGIFYPAGSGTPTTGPPNPPRVSGTPALSASTLPYDDSIEYVFSVSLDQLKAMATMNLTDLSSFPVPVPDGSLIVVERTLMQFDATTPLKGNGIVVLIGNVTLTPGNGSNFSGFLYVDGNLTVREPSDLRGAVICTGNMTVQGSADYATISYDQAVLDTLRQNYGSYNIAGAVDRPWKTDR